VTEGIDALGEVSVRIGNGHTESSRINPQNEVSGRPIFHGHGTDTDIIVASAKAYLAALNRLLAIHGKENETVPNRPTEQQQPAPSELEPNPVTA
jgi:2-isopropylmalate synthase